MTTPNPAVYWTFASHVCRVARTECDRRNEEGGMLTVIRIRLL
jgi:hypothetical protein